MSIDVNKFEKIDGKEALQRLANGESVWNEHEAEIHIDFTDNKLKIKNCDVNLLDSIQDILSNESFIKKPFDVRQAMLDHPNEWVGAFLRDDDKWMAIGFDTEEFEVSTIQIQSIEVASPKEAMLCEMLESSRYLDRCIPLEDVPKEAER